MWLTGGLASRLGSTSTVYWTLPTPSSKTPARTEAVADANSLGWMWDVPCLLSSASARLYWLTSYARVI